MGLSFATNLFEEYEYASIVSQPWFPPNDFYRKAYLYRLICAHDCWILKNRIIHGRENCTDRIAQKEKHNWDGYPMHMLRNMISGAFQCCFLTRNAQNCKTIFWFGFTRCRLTMDCLRGTRSSPVLRAVVYIISPAEPKMDSPDAGYTSPPGRERGKPGCFSLKEN